MWGRAEQIALCNRHYPEVNHLPGQGKLQKLYPNSILV